MNHQPGRFEKLYPNERTRNLTILLSESDYNYLVSQAEAEGKHTATLARIWVVERIELKKALTK